MFKQLLQAGAIDVLQLDSTRVGGVNENIANLLLAARFGVPVCPHAGGVGLCELVQHFSFFDYAAISGSQDGRMIEYVDHLHEHFAEPVRIVNGRYAAPELPGTGAEMLSASRTRWEFPAGAGWVEVGNRAAVTGGFADSGRGGPMTHHGRGSQRACRRPPTRPSKRAARRIRTRAPAWLDAVAAASTHDADALVEIAGQETHLGEARLRGELKRTVFQLRLFAAEIRSGEHFDATIDHADPDWGMGPRPDLRRLNVPLGVVGVFGASNFPFAFSVMGGDSASALAAGCAVVHKAHDGHRGSRSAPPRP